MQSTIHVHIMKPGEKDFLELDGFEEISSMNDAQRRIPEGVYTTFRTYQGSKAIRLSDHFTRLEESARFLEQPLEINRAVIRSGLRDIVAGAGFVESRVRICVDLATISGCVYLIIEPLQTPLLLDYEQGVGVVTRRVKRENPKAKSTEFFHRAEIIRDEVLMKYKVDEVIMVSPNGELLEGLSSNFFAISEGKIWTADEGVLSGFTRDITVEAANQLKIPIIFRGLAETQLGELDEAFITSASRAVLPVTTLDGTKIGKGSPGNVTKAIMQRVDELIATMVEEI
jgi:branched-chain amino acid aminotransferase